MAIVVLVAIRSKTTTDRMAHTFGKSLHKDVRMTITGQIRGLFLSDVAIGCYLENVKNRISKYDTSLNTVFRFELPRQDVLYVYFGNFQWICPSNTCSVS